jgi:biopolymer transport protein TolR
MKKSRYSSVSEINITSLVDVMMVLLIIFMLTAPFIHAGIKVKLPKAKSTVIKETEGVMIAVRKDGEIYLNNQKVKADDVEGALRNLKQRVFVRADKDVPYGIVMRVIGDVKSVGIDEVGMITEIEKEKR